MRAEAEIVNTPMFFTKKTRIDPPLVGERFDTAERPLANFDTFVKGGKKLIFVMVKTFSAIETNRIL
jgi:hypothetical protein